MDSWGKARRGERRSRDGTTETEWKAGQKGGGRGMKKGLIEGGRGEVGVESIG